MRSTTRSARPRWLDRTLAQRVDPTTRTADRARRSSATRCPGARGPLARSARGGRVIAAPPSARLAVGRARAARRRAGRRRAPGRGGSAASLLLRPRSRMDRKVPSRRKTGAAVPQRAAPLRPEATCTTAQARVARRAGPPSGLAPLGSPRGRCREWCSRRLSKFSATNSRHKVTPSVRVRRRP